MQKKIPLKSERIQNQKRTAGTLKSTTFFLCIAYYYLFTSVSFVAASFFFFYFPHKRSRSFKMHRKNVIFMVCNFYLFILIFANMFVYYYLTLSHLHKTNYNMSKLRKRIRSIKKSPNCNAFTKNRR